jgi:hypothetical protein
MDVLIVEPMDPEVVDWLSGRHDTRYEPELVVDPAIQEKAQALLARYKF